MELKLEEVTKRYGNTEAVSQVSYTLKAGVYGLLGANGAGKTTLMRMLCTLMKPTQGSITCNGKDIFEMGGEYRKRLGYLPQEFGFYPDLTVQEYLMYIASIKGLPRAAAGKKVKELIRLTGLAKVSTRKMKKLSGGMKRRAGIAQAMLNEPEILILDEPTAGLDPNERIRFRNLLSGLARERMVLLSTHIVSDVESIAGQIILMDEGKIVDSGSPADIMASVPVKAWTCRMSGEDGAHFAKQYQVSNMKSVADGMELRILSDKKPCQDAVQTDLTLEDTFLYYFGEKGDEEDAIL